MEHAWGIIKVISVCSLIIMLFTPGGPQMLAEAYATVLLGIWEFITSVGDLVVPDKSA